MNFKVVSILTLATLITGVAEAAPKRKAAPAARTYETTYEPRETRHASAGGQRMAGCGLGSMVVEDSNKWAQVGAAFLNGTGMQTFGISFGTSNCTEDGVATAAREKDAFVESNLADLQRDVAAGQGEYLSSLAGFYGCEGAAAKNFGAALHRNQERVLGTSSADAVQVIDTVVASEKASCQG